MDLTTAGLVTGAVGFVVGSSITTIIFLIVIANKKRKLKKESIKRHEIIGSIGKKCAGIDHAYSEFRIGKIPFESLGAMILEKIEDVSTELNSNSDILDAFYIKNIERFLEDQKSTLMNGVRNAENQERNTVRPIGMIPPTTNIPDTEAAAAVSIADKESGIHEISAEESQEEEFSVEAADDVDEFHIEEEPAFTPPPQAEFGDDPFDQDDADSAFNTQDSQININEEADFDFNATTVLSVDEIKGAFQKETSYSPMPTSPQPQQPVTPQASLEGQSLLSGDEMGAAMFSESKAQASLQEQMTPPPPQPAEPVQNETAPQQNQPFVDMDATQVFDQSMFQAAAQQQQQFTAPSTAPQPQPKAPLQFEQPIPEPPASAVQSTPLQQSAFPQQSLSAFDVEATQEFHVSDIMQHAQMDKSAQAASRQDEEVFEINMPGSASQKPKQQSNNDMVSGDDVANQMDNFFGFD